MNRVILKYGKKIDLSSACPECRNLKIINHPKFFECSQCFCQWKEIESNNPKICENCGKDVDGRCDDCGYVWGRGRWRQLGMYDG